MRHNPRGFEGTLTGLSRRTKRGLVPASLPRWFKSEALIVSKAIKSLLQRSRHKTDTICGTCISHGLVNSSFFAVTRERIHKTSEENAASGKTPKKQTQRLKGTTLYQPIRASVTSERFIKWTVRQWQCIWLAGSGKLPGGQICTIFFELENSKYFVVFLK